MLLFGIRVQLVCAELSVAKWLYESRSKPAIENVDRLMVRNGVGCVTFLGGSRKV
jgi:hypothetical protein